MIRMMNKIEKIPAETRKQKVAVYCRVSTDRDTQLISLDNQKSHYERLTAAIGNWELTDYYYEKGISGTKKETRPKLQRMLHDFESGRIDLILTKSISRFARNTTHCLELVRRLNALGISIYFEKENINTLDAKGEVLITIMASLAQQESQSISQNVKMGIHYQFQQGKVRLNHSCFLGYTKDSSGNLIVVQEEADIVRRIFREFLAGKSTRKIALDLTRDGIPTASGRGKWHDSCYTLNAQK